VKGAAARDDALAGVGELDEDRADPASGQHAAGSPFELRAARVVAPTVDVEVRHRRPRLLTYGALNRSREARMALARVVTFEGVGKDQIEKMKQDMSGQERPEEIPATEVVVMHDPEEEKSLVVVFFDTEEDYQRGDAALNAMPTGDTPGQRTSVKKYEVPIRMAD
jgi:hypothetical protein